MFLFLQFTVTATFCHILPCSNNTSHDATHRIACWILTVCQDQHHQFVTQAFLHKGVLSMPKPI